MNREILYVLLPCYNEEKNIRYLVEEWKSQECTLHGKNISLRMIIINDGSTDHTLTIARALEDIYENLTVLNHGENKGLGEALNTGINFVISRKDGSMLCIMDADLTQQPHYVHGMIDKLMEEKIHCVIASRYRKGSKVEGLSFVRKMISYGARLVYTFTLNIPNVRDYTCGYRLYSIDALDRMSKKYNGRIIGEKSFACMVELLFKINKNGFSIGEVPFILKYHLKLGKSKMRIIKTILRSLLLIRKLRKVQALRV